MEVFTLYFDGSCGPKNPGGTAAYGYKLVRAGEELETGHDIIGTGPGMTNNLAEFYGLATGLNAFMKRILMENQVKMPAILNVRGDSQLVINVMSRRWKAKSDKAYFQAYEAAERTARLIRNYGIPVGFDWIPREANQHCDDLSKAHLSAKVA